MKSYLSTVKNSNETFEQYFPVVLFIVLHKVVLTFESVQDEIFSKVRPFT